jgi:hypothetical protein
MGPRTFSGGDKDDIQYDLYGTTSMAINFPHRKDAAEVVITTSYALVDTGSIVDGEFICD